MLIMCLCFFKGGSQSYGGGQSGGSSYGGSSGGKSRLPNYPTQSRRSFSISIRIRVQERDFFGPILPPDCMVFNSAELQRRLTTSSISERLVTPCAFASRVTVCLCAFNPIRFTLIQICHYLSRLFIWRRRTRQPSDSCDSHPERYEKILMNV